jgi:hypothetical protein
MLGFVEEEHILEYMASYLGIPEDAVPPPLRRFVSQAPTLPITSIFWGIFVGNSHEFRNSPTFPKKHAQISRKKLGQLGR